MRSLYKHDQLTGHEQLEEFLDNATVGIHLVDKNGIILYANKCELQMLGYNADEYIGKNITEFHADKPVIDDIFSKLLNNKPLNNQEARLRCKDGSTREVLISSNVFWEKDEFVHTRCFTRDVSH